LESYSIGVDLGATNLRVAAYAEKAGLLETLNLSTRRHAGRDAVMSDLIDAVQTLRKAFGSSYRFTGVGVATPGPMELPEGRLLTPLICLGGKTSP